MESSWVSPVAYVIRFALNGHFQFHQILNLITNVAILFSIIFVINTLFSLSQVMFLLSFITVDAQFCKSLINMDFIWIYAVSCFRNANNNNSKNYFFLILIYIFMLNINALCLRIMCDNPSSSLGLWLTVHWS